MYLAELSILNFKNIAEADLHFSKNVNCFVGLNGMGKTNVLDAVYYLSLCKSAFNSIDSQNINHDADFAMLQGQYAEVEGLVSDADTEMLQVSCGLKRGQKKQFRLGKKDYKRLSDHIGLLPLVMVSPRDTDLIVAGSEERRRLMDSIISQYDKIYLQHLLSYGNLLRQRNALLKQYEDKVSSSLSEAEEQLFEVIEMQMAEHGQYIYSSRVQFVESFIVAFQQMHSYISAEKETVELKYVSQLHTRDLLAAFKSTRQRDLMLGWTSQGIHKDDLEMTLGNYPLKQVGSEGQRKTYLIALKLAEALFLKSQMDNLGFAGRMPILLLDDIFDKLDAERVGKIVELVGSDRFGQIFITDTDRQHIVDLLKPIGLECKIFNVENGEIKQINS